MSRVLDHRWFRRTLALSAVCVSAGTTLGCGSTANESADAAVTADAYVPLLLYYLPEAELVEGADRPIVYVAMLDESLSLDDQVTIVEALDDDFDLRFVDEPGAAVDGGVEGSPPRDEGVLVGIGSISPEPPHVVRVEVYEAAAEVDAYLVTMLPRGDDWMVGPVETVSAEVLDDEP